MTTDAGTEGVLPDTTQKQEYMATGAQPGNKDTGTKKERPKSILALLEFAYGEEGRKLNLARRDLRELSLQPEAAQAEIDAVRRLAPGDPFLSVPPSLLTAVAELGTEPLVLRRILDLVLAAFATHKVFENRLERLTDPQTHGVLTAHEVNTAAKNISIEALGLQKASDFNEAARTRLRVNAVTSFELFHILRDHWTADRFIEDMAACVWDGRLERSVPKAAATLVAVKNTEALSQLSRHFEVLLREEKRETAEAIARTRVQELRAITAEAFGKKLAADLEDANARTAELVAQMNDLRQRLAAEQSRRVVDKSHHVDDYESLRTKVIRRLTNQVELLSDGLHALRHGSTGVAEEFVDRALTAIDGEVKRLKDLDGGAQ